MAIYEYVGNGHVHTTYSDGEGLHQPIAEAASAAGLDFVIVTDHNVWVDGLEGYYDDVLLLVGEEIHDVRREPQANHLVVYGAEREMVHHAADPQGLIDAVKEQGGLCYIAHPFERAPAGWEEIPWVDWEVTGYTGLEVWNYMSEYKALARNRLAAIFCAYLPSWGIRGPFPDTLRKWDELLMDGRRVAALGSADAHATPFSLGPLERVIFPYEHLFKCVNTHVLADRPLNGEADHDKAVLYEAMRAGRTWAGYDMIGSTAGFSFVARSGVNEAVSGQDLVRLGAVIFEVETPLPGEIRLISQGRVVARAQGTYLKYTSAEPGAYRVEVYRRHALRRRGWIFSSPIYVA